LRTSLRDIANSPHCRVEQGVASISMAWRGNGTDFLGRTIQVSFGYGRAPGIRGIEPRNHARL